MQSSIKNHPLFPGALLAALSGALLGFVPLRNWDTWWHLAMGQLIERFHAVPIANHTTYGVAPETPSVLHAWLAQWTMALIDGALGIEGVLTLRNLMVCVALFLVLSLMQRLTSRAQLITGVLCCALVMSVTFATPAVLATPLFALCVWCVHRATLHPDSATMRWPAELACMLVPVASTALWANLDVAYGLLALLSGFALLHAVLFPKTKDKKSVLFSRIGWLLSTLLSLGVAPLLNPRGAALLPHTLQMLTLYPMHPDAPLWAHLFSASQAPVLLLVLAAAAWLVWSNTRHIEKKRLVLFLALFLPLMLFALTHLRAVMWLGLSAPLLVCVPNAGDRQQSDRDLPSRAKLVGYLIACVLIVLSTQPIFIWRASFVEPIAAPLDLRPTSPHQYSIRQDVPIEAMALMKNSSGQPRVWASRKYEGLVQYHLLRDGVVQVTLTDPRLEMFPPATLDLPELMREDGDLWRGIFQGYGIQAALLDTQEDAALIAALRAHPSWQLAHSTEGGAHYFVKVEAAP